MAILNGKEILFSAALSKPTSQKLVKLTAPDAQLTPAAFQEYPVGVGYRSSDFTPAGATAYLDSTDKEAVFFAITDTTATPVGLTIDLGEEKDVELLQLHTFQTFQSVRFGIYTSTDGAAFELAGVQSIGGDSHGAKEVQRLSVNAKARFIRIEQQEGWTRYRFVLKGLEVFGPVTSGSYDLIKDGATQESISVDEIFEKGSAEGYELGHEQGMADSPAHAENAILKSIVDRTISGEFTTPDDWGFDAYSLAFTKITKLVVSDKCGLGKIYGSEFAKMNSLIEVDFYKAGINGFLFQDDTKLETFTFFKRVTWVGNGCFNGCSGLKNLIFKSTVKINNNNLDFTKSTLLTVESLLNLLNALEDNTGGTQYTLKLGSTNLAKLTDEQKQIAYDKNIALS